MKLSDVEYSALDGIRRSDLWVLNKTPLHFHYHMLHKDEEEPSKELTFGIAAHMRVLEPNEYEKRYAVVPKFDRRTKLGKEQYEQFMLANEGKTLIDEDDAKTIEEMYEALKLHPYALDLLGGNRHEEVFSWVDKETEISCKIKCDSIVEFNGKPYVVDYKTTRSCEDGAFERSARAFGYDFQSGMYCTGIGECELQEYGFVFVAQEKTAPYAVRVYWCSDEFVENGKRKFKQLLKKYKECIDSNEWVGYEDEELLEETYE